MFERKDDASFLFFQRKRLRFLLSFIVAAGIPFFANAQSNPGAILGSQCITAGATPTAFTSIRNADISGGLTISWEKSVDLAFTIPITIGGATGQTYAEGAILATTYYRRVINSIPVSYSNIITVTVVGAVANPSFNPQVPPFPIICQQVTSFPVNYTTTGNPDRYSIFWDAAAVAAGFVDAIDVVLGATPGNITVNVPAAAAAAVYNGTLIAVNTGNGCTVSNASSVLINPLPTITGILSACVNATTALNGSGTAAAINPWVSSNTAVATVDNAGLVTAVSAGTSIITYTNNNGCQQTATVTVNALPTIGGTLNVCVNATSSLTGSGTAAAVTPWTSSNTAVATVDNTGVVTGVSTGTSIITYTNNNGCQKTATVTINALPTATITPGGATTFCAGGSVNLTANTGAGYSWLWNTGETTQSIPVTGTASKTVTVTDGNTCSATSSVTTVTVNALPTATITPGGATTFCAGGSVNLTANTGAGYSWLWNTGETTQSISVTTTASKTVTVTDGNTCSATSSVTTVTVNALPTATITPGSATTFCAGGSVNLTASTGAGYSWLWNTGETTQSIPITTTASKTVTVIDGNNCSATSSVTSVTVNPLPVVTISASGPTTFCSGGSVTLNSTAGTSYLWSSGQTTQSISVNSTGTRTVTMTDGNGCSATSSVTTITVNPLPTVAISAGGPTTFCSGGSVTLNSTAGTSYLWSSGQTTQSISVNSTGTRTVTMADGNGCSATSSVTTITVNPLPTVTISAGSPTTFCSGGSVTLSSTAGSSYLWSSGQTTQSISVNSTGTRTVTMTDGNGCSATSSVTSVTVNPLPTVTISAGSPTTFCSGGSVTLSSTAGSSYLWSSGQTTQSISVNSTGTRTVTMTDGNGCSAISSVTTITVNPSPTVTISAGGPTTFCSGGSVTLSSTLGSSYLWSSGQTTQSISVNNTGTRTVTMTDGNGCSATSSVTTVTVNPLPTVAISAGGPTTFCSGGSVTLNSTPGTSYLWSSGQTTQSINVNSTGTRTVTLTDGNGCSATSSVTSVTVNPLPVINAITGNNTVCIGSTITLTNTTPGGIWSSSVPSVAAISSSGILTGISAGATNISYTVTDVNNCTASVSSSKTVNAPPVMVITNPAAVCAPNAVDITTSSITAGTDPAANLSYWSDAAATGLFITPNAVTNSGTYYIKGTLPAAGCSSIRPVAVTVNPLPSFSIANPAAVCEPATVDITAATVTNGSAAGLTLSYWRNQTATTALTTPGALTSSGTYYIKAIAVTGCSVSLPVSVTVNPLPNGSLQMPSVNFICDGTPLTLTASNAFAYQWYINQQPIGGATAATHNAAVPGNYSVLFSTAAGCKKISDSTITLNLFVKPIVRFGASGRCITSPVNFTNTSLFANSGSINWLWDFGDGSSSNNISVSHNYRQAGSYNVSLTANNISCPALTDQATTVYDIEAPPGAVRYDTVFAVNGKSFVLSAREIGVAYQWQPSTGLSSAVVRKPTATLAADISYTVSITSSAGCVTTDTVFVKLKNDGEIYVAQGFTPNGDGLNDRAYPILVGVKQLVYFKIFNRWGNLLFQTKDEAPQSGWDGTYQGRLQQPGTYTWIAEVIDGNGKTILKKGSLLLIN